jgi:hypothetical protein
MSSASFWSDACKYAEGRPLQALLDAAHANFGLLVRQSPAAAAAAAAAAALYVACWVC